MNMGITTKNITISIISLITLLFLLPQTSFAYRAEHPREAVRVVCDRSCSDNNLNNNPTLQITGVKGKLYGTVRTQKFDMRRSDNGSNLSQAGSNIPVGTTLTYNSPARAEGTWFFEGGVFDSPDMNGQWYRLGTERNPIKIGGLNTRVKVERPENNPPSRIKGDGAVSCNGNICTANRTGTASIRIEFPATKAQINGEIEGARLADRDESEFRFKSTGFTYRFNVYEPNREPVITSCSASNISYTSGRINWSYSDPDGDEQSKAYVQVATASDFSTNSLVVDRVIYGSQNNTDITSGLSHSTTYYFRVKANDGKVDGDWRDCGSFQTSVNSPHTINLTSLSAATTSPEKYTTAIVEWEYTDPERDPQTEAQIQISTNNSFPNNPDITKTYGSNGTGTNYTRRGLLPGETYYVRVRAKNGPNGWSGWTSSRSVTMDNYPVPQVTYSISKTGDASTAKTNGQTLVLKTGDKVNANWSIDNGTEVGLESCALSTTGGGNLASSITGQPGEQDFKNSLAGTGFSRNVNNKQVPTITEDRTYSVNLICTGKPAKTVRSVNQAIMLKVESYPIVSSCSVVGSRIVQEGQTNVNIQAKVGNVSSYRFTIGRKAGDRQPLSGDESNLNLNRTLSYTGIEFGRHNPWIEVTNTSNGRKSDRKQCGTVTNLGDSNIREVR